MTVNCISFALYFQQFSLLKAIPRDSERSNNDVFELNILTNFNLIWYFRWYGTNKLQSIHFVFFVCSRIHLTVLLFGCFITLCFLSYSVFPPFWVGSLRSQTLDSWFCVEQEVQVPKKCTRVWAKRPLFWINLGFPKIVRSRTIFLCIAPPKLAHGFGHVSELVPAWHIYKHHVLYGTSSDTRPKTCAQNYRYIWDRFAQINLAVQLQLQLHFCSTHINPWKQGILGTETTLLEN